MNAGIEECDYKPDPSETAHHEAWHAVLALCFGWAVDRMQVLDDHPHKAGDTQLARGDAPEVEEPVNSIAFLVAGYCAELIARGRPADELSGPFWLWAEQDRMEAARIARAQLGCNRRHGGKLYTIARCVFHFIDEVAKAQVEALADKLLDERELTRDRINAIWESAPVSVANIERFRSELLNC